MPEPVTKKYTDARMLIRGKIATKKVFKKLFLSEELKLPARTYIEQIASAIKISDRHEYNGNSNSREYYD